MLRTILVAVAVLALCTGVGLVGAFLFTSHQPTLYSSKVIVRVYDPTNVPNATSGRVDPTRLVTLEVSYAQSRQVSDVATRALAARRIIADHVTWTGAADQDAISVNCFVGKPSAAVTCAEVYAAEYLAVRREAVSRPLTTAAKTVDGQVAALRKNATALQASIAATDPITGADALRGLLAQQTSVLDQITSLVQQANTIRAQAVALSTNYDVVQHAVLPKNKVSPTGSRNLALGLLAGLVLGVAALLLWQQIASALRSRPAARTAS